MKIATIRKNAFGRSIVAVAMAIAVAASAIPDYSIAHQGATGVVKQRMDAMKSIAADMKILLQMDRKQRKFDARVASRAATAIAGHSSTMPGLFPKGSNAHPSEARKEIWTGWTEFSRLMKDMERAGKNYAQKAQSVAGVAALRGEFRALAASCSACHEKFRAKH
jgi:cytochrome c556